MQVRRLGIIFANRVEYFSHVSIIAALCKLMVVHK